MGSLKEFFLFCSGSNQTILNRTPTEVNKYVGIGACVFFTGLFAFLAASYAIFTIFNSYIAAIGFGLVWGLMIFNLDRYIVSTIKKSGSILKDFFFASPRIMLAILIALVISKPLELKIFDSEIQAELNLMEQENYKKQESLIHSRYTENLNLAKSELAKLKAEINDLEAIHLALAAEAVAEADGTGGSKQRNLGPIYKAKKAQADQAAQNTRNKMQFNAPLITAKQKQIDELQSKMDADIANADKVLLSGFAARIDALSRVSEESNAIAMASLFIMLLFIAIETAPVFVKLITSRSPYDYVLDKHEHAFKVNHKLITTLKSNAVKNEIKQEIQVTAYETDLAINKAKRKLTEQFSGTSIQTYNL